FLHGNSPFGPGHEFRTVPNPSNNFIVKQVAQEAVKFLYSQFDTSKVCPLHLKEVIRAKESTNNGIYYDLEVQVETNAADFDCEFAMKNCVNVRVHQPLFNLCPGKKFCLLPIKLDEVECIDVPQSKFRN
ncbi:Uncharacterized protein FKW44_013493, partial [Caligus rogercresseyi]